MEEVTDRTSAVGDADTESEIRTESIIEALLFSTDQPLTAAKIAEILGIGNAGDIRRHVDTLNARYADAGAAFRIEAVAKGFQMLTMPVYNPWVGKLHKARSDSRLSPAALETLAIVAYKQPVLRADVEAIRGVAVGDMLVRLREMNLIRIVGRAEELGRPLLYGTTGKFLEVFGLKSTQDLPKLDPDRPDDVPPLKVINAPKVADSDAFEQQGDQERDERAASLENEE